MKMQPTITSLMRERREAMAQWEDDPQDITYDEMIEYILSVDDRIRVLAANLSPNEPEPTASTMDADEDAEYERVYWGRHGYQG